jgi:hypothetical protein
MLISNKYKFAFVHIPKTGGTSIKAAILPYADKGQLSIVGEKVTDLNGYKPHIALQQGAHVDKFKFAVVRNNWEWYVSYWKFANRRKIQPVCNQSFGQYIRSLGHGATKMGNQQSWWITNGDEILVDYIIRYENLTEGFMEVCEQLSLPKLDLGHYKNSGDYAYRDFYDDETKTIVERHCRKDLRLFGYEF